MAEQGELPTLERTPMDALNEARFHAYRIALEAVEFLHTTMNDAEEDTDRRIMAAAEILNFIKVP